jgi:hypothetical protein
MSVALDQAGAQHSLSPMDAEERNGDAASLRPPGSESVVNIAHLQKELTDKNTTRTHCTDFARKCTPFHASFCVQVPIVG